MESTGLCRYTHSESSEKPPPAITAAAVRRSSRNTVSLNGRKTSSPSCRSSCRSRRTPYTRQGRPVSCSALTRVSPPCAVWYTSRCSPCSAAAASTASRSTGATSVVLGRRSGGRKNVGTIAQYRPGAFVRAICRASSKSRMSSPMSSASWTQRSSIMMLSTLMAGTRLRLATVSTNASKSLTTTSGSKSLAIS